MFLQMKFLKFILSSSVAIETAAATAAAAVTVDDSK